MKNLFIITLFLLVCSHAFSVDVETITSPFAEMEGYKSMEPTTGIITGDGVNFRLGPGTNYGILGQFYKGAKVDVYASLGDWYICVDAVSGKIGAVNSDYVDLDKKAFVANEAKKTIPVDVKPADPPVKQEIITLSESVVADTKNIGETTAKVVLEPEKTSGVRSKLMGIIVDSSTGQPLPGISVRLNNSGETTISGYDGSFYFERISVKSDILTISSPEISMFQKQIEIAPNQTNDLGTISVSKSNARNLLNEGAFVLLDEELIGEEADQGDYNVSSLLSSSNDIYLSNSAYDFSAVRFKLRGYDYRYFDNYINGVNFSDIERGGFSYGMIGGLNDATRNNDITNLMLPTTFSFGQIGTSSNIITNASSYAVGTKATLAYTNRNYKLRGVVTHSTGLMNNGWAITGSVAYRWADEGFVEGTFYNSLAAFLAVEKVLNDHHKLSLTALAAPTQRAQQSAVIQEIADLLDNNYYNSNWGYQNGKKRSSRIVTTIEPTAILSHNWTVNNTTKLITGLGFNYKKYGTTRLEYNNGANPRPDYYKNLPSNQQTLDGQVDLKKAWLTDFSVRQIDWNHFYRVNDEKMREGDGNVYALGENHNDQMNLTLNSVLTTKLSQRVTLTAGLEARTTKGSDYETIADLLGGSYFENINFYNQAPSGQNSDRIQYDLNNPNQKAVKGDKIRYDYNMYVNNASVFFQNKHNYNKWDIYYGMKIGYTDFYRNGNMRNGSAPDNSYGKGKTHSFVHQTSKFGLTYKFSGRHMFSGNVHYSTLPPLSDNAYLSSRVKDDVIPELKNEQIFAADVSYNISTPIIRGRITAYQTYFYDLSRIYHMYSDTDGTFVNMVLYGMKNLHRGLEAGVEVKINSNVSVSAIGTLAEYKYNNNPDGIISADNGLTEMYVNRMDTYYMKGLYISGTPQTAGSLGVHYFHPKYWFFDAKINGFSNIYIDPSPLRRTERSWEGIDKTTPEGQALIEQINHQEKFDGGFTVDVSIGKSLRIQQGKYMLNINLQFCNILNNIDLKTGGYEYNRYGTPENLVGNKFPSFYYYAQGFNCFLNAGFRF